MSNCDKASEMFMSLHNLEIQGDLSLSQAFSKYRSDNDIDMDHREFFIGFITLLGMCAKDAKDSAMDERKIDVVFDRISNYQIELFSRSHAAKWSGLSKQWLKRAGEDFLMYEAMISPYTAEKFDNEYVDKLSKDMSKKIAEVRNIHIPDHAKKSIIMALSSIHRICSEFSLFGEQDLKFRIKSVMCDLQIQYNTLESDDQKKVTTLIDWLSKGISGGRYFLGLSADTGTVGTLLLDAPK